MLVTLNADLLTNGLKVPPGKRRIEYVDAGGPAGLYLEVRASSEGEGTFWMRYRRKADNRMMHHKIGRTTEISLVDARRMAKRLRAEVVLGGDPRGAILAKKNIPTYEEFMRDSYFPYIEVRKKSHKRDEQLWRVHVRDRLGKKRLTEITRLHVQSVQTAMVEQGLAPATANHGAKLIRSSLALACQWNLLEKNPAARIPMLFEDNKIQRILDDAELARLLHILRTDRNQCVCRIVMFLLSTGCRLNEVLAATWAEVDIERRIFVVRALNSKNKRLRSVPLNDSALDVLNSLATKSAAGPVFVSPRTGLAFTTIAKQFDRIRKAAGLPKFRIHDCRHFFASALVSSGRTLFETQQILGHSSPLVTMRYAHLSTKALQEAANSASIKIKGGLKPAA